MKKRLKSQHQVKWIRKCQRQMKSCKHHQCERTNIRWTVVEKQALTFKFQLVLQTHPGEVVKRNGCPVLFERRAAW